MHRFQNFVGICANLGISAIDEFCAARASSTQNHIQLIQGYTPKSYRSESVFCSTDIIYSNAHDTFKLQKCILFLWTVYSVYNIKY